MNAYSSWIVPLYKICIAFILLLQPNFPGSALAISEESRSALAQLEQRVKLHELSNGLKVIWYQRGNAPVFAGVVTVRVGSINERLGETGISHMLEHMAFKGTTIVGTKDYSKERSLLDKLEQIITDLQQQGSENQELLRQRDELQKELELLWDTRELDRAYKLHGADDLNATTGTELTNYFVNFPRPAFEFWCWIESERIVNPVMRQFYKERDVVMEERRMRYDDDPEGKLYELLLGTAFRIHPYRNPVIGYEFDLKGLMAKQVFDYQRQFYGAQNIVIALVGDVDPERDLALVDKYFGRIPARSVPEQSIVYEPPQMGEREVQLEAAAAPSVMLAYRKPNYPDPDDPPLSVLQEILAGGKVSPLYTELVKKRQIAAAIGYFEAPGVRDPNLMIFHAAVKHPHTNEELIRAFDQVIAGFKSRKVTEEELGIAKRAIAMSYLAGLDSNMSLAQDLTSAQLLYGDWRTLVNWYDEAMRVSAEDVERVAKQYLITNARTLAHIESLRR